MKPTFLLKTAGLTLGLLFAALISNNAVAGPGPQYWAAQNKPKADATVLTPKVDVTVVKLCPGAEVVASTIMKPAMPNGKGPLVPMQGGTKIVCHMCPVTTLVPKSAIGNGKGPMTFTEVTKTGAEHNCVTCCGTPDKS